MQNHVFMQLCILQLLSAVIINYLLRRRKKVNPWFKVNTLIQRTEHNWNNIFINLSIPWMSEISGAINLPQPGLTAGRGAHGQEGEEGERRVGGLAGR